MTHPRYQDRIIRDPQRCGGERIIRGTRVTLRVILASVAEGDRPEEIVRAFPSLCLEDVQAAIEFSAEFHDAGIPEKAPLLQAS